MKTFPMFLQMQGRDVIIVGGGEQAAQKARLMLKTEARLVFFAPHLDDELQQIVDDGKAVHLSEAVTAADFSKAVLVFVATGCPASDVAFRDLAKAGGAVVNVVDRPDLCDAVTPSIVDRDPVVVAIGTEGTAPVLARQIKTRIETLLEPRLGDFAAMAGRLRSAVARHVPVAERRSFWRWAFNETPRRLHREGKEREAARIIKEAIQMGQAPDEPSAGMISLVGAGPGSRDLLTLRAVQRLQEADIIYYDRLVDPQVLELARRDAERVYVGKTVGASPWPQDRINAVVTASAARGLRVVRLKSGDPSVFGRSTEEVEAARQAGIPVEVVPGITAASAAAATTQSALTERGKTDRVIYVTATCQDGEAEPKWGSLLTPGTSMVIYMGVAKASAIQNSMIKGGVPRNTDVCIAASVSTGQERIVSCDVASLAITIEREKIENPAIIMIRRAKQSRIVSNTDTIKVA